MKTVIEMAIEAGVAFDSEEYPDIWMTYMNVGRKEIEAFAELVRADAIADAVEREREACAKVCDELANDEKTDEYINGADWCSVRIRARSNT